jgi:hypothetical protein
MCVIHAFIPFCVCVCVCVNAKKLSAEQWICVHLFMHVLRVNVNNVCYTVVYVSKCGLMNICVNVNKHPLQQHMPCESAPCIYTHACIHRFKNRHTYLAKHIMHTHIHTNS